VAIGGLEDVDFVAGRAVVDGVLAGNGGHIYDEAADVNYGCQVGTIPVQNPASFSTKVT